MSALDQQVGRARRRLTTNVFFQWAALSVLVAGGLWGLVVVVEQTFVIGIPLAVIPWIALGGAVVMTLFGTIVRRVDTQRAAVAIDGAAGLKERLSTALVCRTDTDPFAQAAVHDAEKTAARVHVPVHLPYRAPGLWPWSAATVFAAVMLYGFMPKLDLLAGQDDQDDSDQQRDVAIERENITVAVNETFKKIKELAENNPSLKDLDLSPEPIDFPDNPSATPEDIRVEAVKRIDKVSNDLARKKDEAEMAGLDELKRMLSRLDPKRGKDPASKLSQALASGDMSAAKKALQDLQKQLEQAARKGDPAAKRKLDDLQKKLDALAKQLAKLGDTKKLEKELERKAGLSPEQAKKLLEKLAKMDPKQLQKELQKRLADSGMTPKQIEELAKKMAKQQQAMKQCQGLGECLAQAAKAMQQADSPNGTNMGSASASLGEAFGQLSDLEMAEQLLNDLNLAMADLQDLSDGVCEGGMCPGGKPGDKIGSQGPSYGLGYGARIGRERAAHGMKVEKARTKAQPGQIIGQMLIDGPQARGEASAEVRDVVGAAVRDAEDAIERDEVPRRYEGVLRAYFEELAGLAKTKSADGSTKKP